MSLDHRPLGHGHALRAFLFADPAAHSLSPLMHRAAFRHAALSGEYAAVRVPPPQLCAALDSLRQPGTLGANLSLPHKEAALPLLDDLTDAARRIGAVNTVIHRDGQLLGDNTDAPGLLAALENVNAPLWPGGEVVVLGAGGAARAAVYAARQAGQNVTVVNRTPQRAQALQDAWNDPQVTALPAEAVAWTQVNVLINASSAGLSTPDETPLPALNFTALPAGALVYDMVYAPAETRLMREARAAGCRAENGLGMLAHQARLAFHAWTGAAVPVRVFLDALKAGGHL